MKNISVEVEEIIKDDNGDWVVDPEAGIEIKCEEGTEAESSSIITIGERSVRIEDVVEFLQLIGVLTDECWR